MSTYVKLTNASDLKDLLLKIDRALIKGEGLSLTKDEANIVYSCFTQPVVVNKGNSISIATEQTETN